MRTLDNLSADQRLDVGRLPSVPVIVLPAANSLELIRDVLKIQIGRSRRIFGGAVRTNGSLLLPIQNTASSTLSSAEELAFDTQSMTLSRECSMSAKTAWVGVRCEVGNESADAPPFRPPVPIIPIIIPGPPPSWPSLAPCASALAFLFLHLCHLRLPLHFPTCCASRRRTTKSRETNAWCPFLQHWDP